ncbi:DUF2478 domain-containing protein [Thioclava sp. F36-7]|uniref:DUF2478 domain-containing protein n=1 Tax=Thioclava sp. F36-7 TaxID=1915317 RepID=UPI000996FDEB|nr:DUF2478 domain-containing protein [Thioclava sp. F36-7]OOY07130.1 hypothetical protein BMI89_19140 [Thioclava sp. F36-7]
MIDWKGHEMFPIAAIQSPGRGDVDFLMARFARQVIARGHRVCGVVQVNIDRPKSHACDMDIKVLPDGPVLSISQSLGEGSRGCRLDPAALEASVAAVSHSLAYGADLLVVNKFGKMESEGRGFRPVIAEAILQGIPVLVGINGLNELAYDEFTGGYGCRLPFSLEALNDWFDDARGLVGA